MRGLAFALGTVLILCGGLFAAQGAGLVMWPPESFMLARSVWIGRGLVVALLGTAMLLAAYRIRK